MDVYHTVSTLQKDPDPILAPLFEAAKADTDYQMIIQALGKFKNSKSLPFTHPGRQLNSVLTQLNIDDFLGLIILDGNRILVSKSLRQHLLKENHAAHCSTGKTIRRLYLFTNVKIAAPFYHHKLKNQSFQSHLLLVL